MSKWVRRIRGAMGMGLAWAFAWFGAGMALFVVVGPDAADVPFPLGFGALGFLAGITFSGVLGIVEGRRRFEELSLPRFALWGGVGGLLFSGLFVVAAALGVSAFLVLAPVFSLAGAGCAAGSLALARMAEGGPPLPPGHGPAPNDLPEMPASSDNRPLRPGTKKETPPTSENDPPE